MFRLSLIAVIAACAAAGASAADFDAETRVLEEIIVTAPKRGAQHLQDLATSAARTAFDPLS